MRPTTWDFIKSQLTKPKPLVKADLTGKTVVVLGANTGLGFEATKHFATMNPGRLILACRSETKGQAAVEKLKVETGYATAELWIIDLADFASVKRFAEKFEQDGGRLDIMVENAAVAPVRYEPTEDGWEIALQVNCLSSPLLALLLLPSMIKTAHEHSTFPRIVVVSSGMHYWTDIDQNVSEKPGILQTLGSAEYCTPKAYASRYELTKCMRLLYTFLLGPLTILLILNVFFVRALNARLPPATPVIVDAVCPGYCYSELRRSLSGMQAVVDFLMERTLASTAEVGSRQLVWGALAHEDRPEKVRGAYIAISEVQEVSDYVLSAEGAKVQDDIWDEMVDILGRVDPRVTAIVEKYLLPRI
ncbi:short-chain dehydrogenase [Mycena epipterygia]|nr:short-chain dehydrogenase [Mycena epipterygia]